MTLVKECSFRTNTAYILNMYFQNTKKSSFVDGQAFEFIRKEHDAHRGRFIKVTFEVVD